MTTSNSTSSTVPSPGDAINGAAGAPADQPVGRGLDLVAVALAAILLVLFALTPDRDIGDQVARDFDLGGAGLVVAAAAAALLASRAPVLGAAAALAASAVWHQAGYTSGVINALTLIAYYFVGATGDRRRQVGTCAGTFVVVFVLAQPIDAPVAVLYDAIGWPIAAVLLGEAVRARRESVQAIARSAAEAERQRYRDLEQRATEERMRIARDLHDTLAHTIGVMTVQAGVLQRVVATDPPRAAEVAGVIRRVGKDAMREIKATLSVLRADEVQLAPAPGLADVDAVISTARAAGLDVDARIEVGDVPAMVGVTVYRVVQEAITNISRHSLAARVEVAVRDAPGGVGVVVEDPGPARPAGPHANGGHGLVGMRERVEAVGGTLSSGPTAGGGYRVEARIPVETGG